MYFRAIAKKNFTSRRSNNTLVRCAVYPGCTSTSCCVRLLRNNRKNGDRSTSPGIRMELRFIWGTGQSRSLRTLRK